MVKDDIDQLQTFGAKIIEKNQAISRSSKKIKKQDKKKNTNKVNIFNFIKIVIKRLQNKYKHMMKRWIVKINAFFSPYLIKIQTFHKRNQKFSKKEKYTQKHLIEKRKKIGNTIIVIRKWKKAPIKKYSSIPTELQYVYYFHKKTEQKSYFRPKESIWDVPIDDEY
jgi:hypothetical protein